MAVSGVQNPNVLASPRSDASMDSTDALGKDAFMKLLVAQLQNQDPLNPMDNREYITQLSQLTGVERLTAIGDRISALSVATAGVANSQASDLVGKTVEAKGDSMLLDQLGEAQSAYKIDEKATVTVKVVNETGDTVRTLTMGEVEAGEHEVKWDGQTDNGTRAEPGRYHIVIDAKNADGEIVTTDTTVKGIVTKVSYEHGYPELVVGGDRRVALGSVIAIGN